ncbi:hypothetical protein ACYTX7_10215, partial [Streptococcus pyogenes]
MDLKLGFRQAPRISVMFRKIVRELILNDEVQVTSKYPVMQENAIPGDLQFVVMEKFLSQDNELPFFERLVMKLY